MKKYKKEIDDLSKELSTLSFVLYEFNVKVTEELENLSSKIYETKKLIEDELKSNE